MQAQIENRNQRSEIRFVLLWIFRIFSTFNPKMLLEDRALDG